MIDWSRVNELKEDFGEEGFAELLPVFVAEIEEALSQLSEANSAEEVASTCHFIKGSAANLGLQQLAELCATAETDAKSGQVAGNLAAQLSEAFQASQTALREAA